MTADAAAAPRAGIGNTLKQRLRGRAEESLAFEAAAGRRLAMRGRTVALAVVAVLIGIVNAHPGFLYYEFLLVLFLLLGLARYALEKSGLWREWQEYLLIALDFGLLTFTLLYPNPLAPFAYPPQMGQSFGNFVYFYILLAGLAFGFQPRKVLWGGVAGACAWLAGVGVLVSLPDTSLTPRGGGTIDAQLALLADQTFVSLAAVARDVAVFVLVAGMMSLVVERSRRLVERQASLERQRSNLARYFPPATVDRLANQDRALGVTREEDAAVLFFDLVGFTHWAESHSPAEVIRLLREVHGRVEAAIFAHDGTLDKFIGDGAMATFGTVEPGPREATNALACAVAIVDEFAAWNAERSRRGETPVRISIGLHHGRVVVGDIGTDRRLEFAVLGDAVNVASRLEELTRELACSAVISGAMARAAKAETGEEAATLLARFREAGFWGLRGRDEAVEVLACG